jgi:hypothetical protein
MSKFEIYNPNFPGSTPPKSPSVCSSSTPGA